MVSIRSVPFSSLPLGLLADGLFIQAPPQDRRGGCLPQATEEFQRAGIELRSQQWPGKSCQRDAQRSTLRTRRLRHALTRGALQGAFLGVRSTYGSRPGLIVGREPHRWRTRRRRAASCTSSGCLQNATIAGRWDTGPFHTPEPCWPRMKANA